MSIAVSILVSADDEFDVEEEIESTQNGGLVEMAQPKEVEPEPEEEQDAA